MKGPNLTNPASESTANSLAHHSVHAGSLRIAGDAPLSAVHADIAFTDDGHLLVTSVGMVLADWPLAEVAIEPEESATAFLRGDDLLVFEPADADAWNEQLAAHRLRTRLAGSPVAVGGGIAPLSHSGSRKPAVAIDVREDNAPIVQVSQNTSVMTPRRTTHWLHLLLTVVTFGLWLPVWIGVSIFTGATNSRSQRPAQQVSRAPRPMASAPAVELKDPDVVRARNNSLSKKVGIGAGVIVLLAILSSVVSSGGSPAADAATSSPAEPALSVATTTTNAPTGGEVPAPTITKPSSAVSDSAAILAGTSGTLRIVLKDLMDSTSCDDLEFDLKFATDNYSFDGRQAERVLAAIGYAQKHHIGGSACGSLDSYLNMLNVSW